MPHPNFLRRRSVIRYLAHQSNSLLQRNVVKWMTRFRSKGSQRVGWVERSETHSSLVQATADFALLYPLYELNPGYDLRHARARRGHPRLLGVRQTKDVDGRNKSGHDDVDALFLPRLRGRVGRGPATSRLAQAATYPLWHRFAP
jgi:hypothetical protein